MTHTRAYPLNNIKLDSYVSTIYVDPSGNIWIGFFGQGLIKIDHTTHQQHYFSELHDASILAIISDSTSIWLATLSGAVQINTKAQPSIRYYNKSNGLSTDYIYQVFIDSKKRVWFGTDGKGVDMLDAQGIHHYEQGLHSKVVYGFAEDVNKNIWVNTQGDGLYTFNGSSFVPLSQKNNQLRDNEISCLSTDKFGNLVVMHDLGLDIYDVVRNKVFHIGDELGLDNFKPTLNAVCRDAQSDLFFGTSHGAIHYASRQTRVQTSPTPFIESLKVMDKKIAPGQALSFGYNQNEITINYTGFWYQNAENLHYQYQLEGLDRNKIDSRDAAAIYSDLPPGDYSFHLKVSDADFYGPEETVISFTILPPFWKTPLFYVLVIGVAVLIIYAIIKFRERQLLLEKRELEEKVAERTIEIQKKNEEIQAQTEEIIGINENLENLVRSRTLELEQKNKALEEYAFITAHELRAPLASILGLVNILCKVKLEEQDKMILDHLREASEKLESIVRTITEAIEKGDQIPPSEQQE
jgi:hypothetical protein